MAHVSYVRMLARIYKLTTTVPLPTTTVPPPNTTSAPPITTLSPPTIITILRSGIKNKLYKYYMNFGPNGTMPSPPFTTNLYNYDSEICAKAIFTDSIFLYILACFYLVIGITFVICGYRFFKTSMFTSGFTLAGFIVYLLCIQDQRLPPYGICIVTTCAALMFGFITMLIEFLGIFITGLQNGVLIGISGMTTYNHMSAKCIPTTYWLTTLIIFFSGFTIACMNISYKKGLTIISTSVCGGAFITIALDYFLHSGATVKWLIERTKLEPVVAPPCTFSWLLLALWPICAILGIIIQWTLTGTGICHEQSLAAQKRRSKAAPLHLTREQRAEMRQRKYRYLYQVRTAHGDVISQPYVQALQQMTSSADPWNAGGGECSTLQSDSTHLTVLASDAPHPDPDSDEDANEIRRCH